MTLQYCQSGQLDTRAVDFDRRFGSGDGLTHPQQVPALLDEQAAEDSIPQYLQAGTRLSGTNQMFVMFDTSPFGRTWNHRRRINA